MLDMVVHGLTEPLVLLGEMYITTRRKGGSLQRTGASSHRVWWFCLGSKRCCSSEGIRKSTRFA